MYIVFFFNDTATTEIYTLSLRRRSSDLSSSATSRPRPRSSERSPTHAAAGRSSPTYRASRERSPSSRARSEEHTSELQSRQYLVCRLLLDKKTNGKGE